MSAKLHAVIAETERQRDTMAVRAQQIAGEFAELQQQLAAANARIAELEAKYEPKGESNEVK